MRKFGLVLSLLLPVCLAQSSFSQGSYDQPYQQQQAPQQFAPQAYPSQSFGGAAAAGSSSLAPGQYILTNLSTGQSMYITVTPNGQMFAQAPPALQPGGGMQQPGQTAEQQPGKLGGLAGLLKQGVNTYMQNKYGGGAAAGTTAQPGFGSALIQGASQFLAPQTAGPSN